ncbi:MAG TPA: fumarylacetoacetate hydrolase family protein [Alphaproteobacteria bacterium]|nr:fumarylacetoacetate hydrolase family protein [Alphaproteobacteria bacterium]
MKFVTFSHGGACRAGVLEGDGSGADDQVVDLGSQALRDAIGEVRPQISDIVASGLGRIASAIEQARIPAEARLPLQDVRLVAPIPKPSRIVGAAHNYRDAIAERGMRPPDEPVIFIKKPETIVGPGDAVVLPPGIGGVTYEAELAAIIGTPADNVSEAHALECVAGYAVFNDISASEMIRADGNFERGKNLPTFGPFGPFIATVDEVPDPHALRIGVSVDGEALQESSTSEMLFGIAELVSFISRQVPLAPGDVIATGTPAGVAPVRKPPTWLRPGTTLRAWVEGLGTLVNPVTEGLRADA